MEETLLTTILSVGVALGLAAACGFRVFVPLFALSLAANADLVTLSEGFAWIGSTPAVVCFGVATVTEVLAYYVPVVDNFLDSIATPAAVVAGVTVSAAVLTDMDPWLKWTLATIAGGAAAAAVQIPMVALRGTSTTTTAGLANPLVSTGEAAAATGISAVSVLWPLLLPVVALTGVWIYYRRIQVTTG